MNYIESDKKIENIKSTYVNKIDPMNKFLPFGKYQIDLKKLKGGKLQFRSKKGYFVKGLENKNLTPNMKIVIDKFISGQNIDYEDVNAVGY